MPPDRIGPPVEFKRGVMGQDRIRRQLGGHQVRIDRIAVGIGARRHDRVQSPPDVHDSSVPSVVGEQRLLAAWADRAVDDQVRSQLLAGEHRMPAEEVRVLHHVSRCRWRPPLNGRGIVRPVNGPTRRPGKLTGVCITHNKDMDYLSHCQLTSRPS